MIEYWGYLLIRVSLAIQVIKRSNPKGMSQDSKIANHSICFCNQSTLICQRIGFNLKPQNHTTVFRRIYSSEEHLILVI